MLMAFEMSSEDPDNCSSEEVIAAYLERGFTREGAEAFTAILKDLSGRA